MHLRRSSDNRHVRYAISHIERSYRSPISLGELALKRGMTKEHLSSLFSNETGCTFTYYCNAVRINRSLYYLICSDYPVALIARLVGFQSPSYFIKVFRVLGGMTPESYRLSQANRFR